MIFWTSNKVEWVSSPAFHDPWKHLSQMENLGTLSRYNIAFCYPQPVYNLGYVPESASHPGSLSPGEETSHKVRLL